MSKNKNRKWYGRPNAPPKNWHTPDKPAIRKVTGWLDDESTKPSSSPSNTDFVVILPNEHWIAILKALQFYDKSKADDYRQKRCMKIRETILGEINFNIDDTKPVAVKLELEDWRIIWHRVCVVCQERGDEWISWFDWLSDTMTKQIKSA